MKNTDLNDHWLARPTTIRRLWWAFSGLLALTALAQMAVEVKGYFAVDGWLGFGAIYGFLSCLAMVLVARGLGHFLKRGEDYYDKDRSDDA